MYSLYKFCKPFVFSTELKVHFVGFVTSYEEIYESHWKKQKCVQMVHVLKVLTKTLKLLTFAKIKTCQRMRCLYLSILIWPCNLTYEQHLGPQQSQWLLTPQWAKKKINDINTGNVIIMQMVKESIVAWTLNSAWTTTNILWQLIYNEVEQGSRNWQLNESPLGI